jgi:hypothetical protein
MITVIVAISFNTLDLFLAGTACEVAIERL